MSLHVRTNEMVQKTILCDIFHVIYSECVRLIRYHPLEPLISLVLLVRTLFLYDRNYSILFVHPTNVSEIKKLSYIYTAKSR